MAVIDKAKAFLAQDPDVQQKAELQVIITRAEKGERDAIDLLNECFGQRLEFGTAGLRGQVGFGTNRMNRLMTIETTWGFGRYLLEETANTSQDVRQKGVVMAFDGRLHSRQFALDASSTLAGLGIPVYAFDQVVPTPVCAFAITHLEASAGIMLTASHNPPEYNGYKAYWANGAQIIPPHDQGISKHIDQAPEFAQIIRLSLFEAIEKGLHHQIGSDVMDAYFKGISSGRWSEPISSHEKTRIVYSAMHGVGDRFVRRALHESQFTSVVSVPSQSEANGLFPTVTFPNPEEDGAMDHSIRLGEELDADLILANDPDADRVAVAVRSRHGQGFERLSGNDVGVLLGHEAIQANQNNEEKNLVIASIVSTRMLGRIAAKHQVNYAETLTGFKWIANTALQRHNDAGESFIFGFEEAIGYCPGPLVNDKDGVQAAVRVAELFAKLKASGMTFHEQLDALAIEYGLFEGVQWSVQQPGSAGKKKIDEVMTIFRNVSPDAILNEKIRRTDDLLNGTIKENGETRATSLPKSNVLVFYSDADTRLIVRPSGTEPKIKFYLEAVREVRSVSELDRQREELQTYASAVKARIGELF